ncbi:hypothetical protein [Clostridium saccharoperbutylacetonicum]
MENIKTLEDVYKILFLEQCNNELLSVVKMYFIAHDPIYKRIVKFYYYDVRAAKCSFNISATEYQGICYKIRTDVAGLVRDYYTNRANTIKESKNVSDFLTYKSNNIKKQY